MRCSRRSRGAGRRSERLGARGRERRSLFWRREAREKREAAEATRRDDGSETTTGPSARSPKPPLPPPPPPPPGGVGNPPPPPPKPASAAAAERVAGDGRRRNVRANSVETCTISSPWKTSRGERRARTLDIHDDLRGEFLREDRAAAAFLFDESSHDCAWRGFRSRRRLAGASALVPAQSLARVGSGEEDARSFGRASRGASRAVRRAQARRRGSWFRASRLRAASARSPVRGPSLDDASSARAATARAPNRGHGPVPGACAGRGRASRRGARG